MSRKRPAPGTSPTGYSQPTAQASNGHANNNNNNNNSGAQLSDDQFLQWGQNPQVPTYQDPQAYNAAQSSFHSNSQPSNQLTRRPMNQIATRPNAPVAQWTDRQNASSPSVEPNTGWSDDIAELEKKAQQAKADAQVQRKQIPPFVQKLHSFLDNPNNWHLIRWSEDGKSFVVLNENEFANTLIPELFKHKNYASFVRQLNMYGFHKKVGLSDNSMRASERKSKSPSEYSNPYFRRGHPNLLWLIQKPKNQTTNQKNKARHKSEENDDAEDYVVEEAGSIDGQRQRPQLSLGRTDNSLSQEQFQNVQRELAVIRQQQTQITRMLSQLKREHDALVDQANDYQNKHSRHEHSINAILTFLATLYNRSLQNHEGAADIAKMFSSTLAQDGKSNVVDVGDYPFNIPNLDQIDTSGQPFRKQRLMITDGSQSDRANTVPPNLSSNPLSRQNRRSSHMMRQSDSPRTAQVEEVFDPGVNSPDYGNPNLNTGGRAQTQGQGQSQHDMLSLIHNTNARNSNPNTPVPDFSNVLNDLENSRGNAPLSKAERDSMLQMINSQTNQPGDSNALHNPSQSTQVNADAQNNFDSRLATTKSDLDDLARMQAEQDKSVQNLASILQPLSPTGSIPGIGDGQNLPPPPGLDIDDFLNHQGYFTDLGDGAGAGDMDFLAGNNDAYNMSGTSNGGAGNLGDSNNMFNYEEDNDPLFDDVDQSGVGSGNGDYDFYNNTNNTSGGGNKRQINHHDFDPDGAGRIESVASSEVSTPPQRGYIGDDAGVDDASGREKYVNSSNKRRRVS